MTLITTTTMAIIRLTVSIGYPPQTASTEWSAFLHLQRADE
jgi:hypothetical protein